MTDRAPATAEKSRDTGSVVVRIPGPLRPLADGAAEVVAEGSTVAEVLDALVGRHPGLRRHLLADDGRIRDYVNVFLNQDDVRYLGGPGTRPAPGDTITIVPSIAGG